MAGLSIRPAVHGDLARLTEIYNYYVIHTPVTFDIEPYTVERRQTWFAQFKPEGRSEEHTSELSHRTVSRMPSSA